MDVHPVTHVTSYQTTFHGIDIVYDLSYTLPPTETPLTVDDMSELHEIMAWSLQNDIVEVTHDTLTLAQLDDTCPRLVFSQKITCDHPDDDKECVICCNAFKPRRHVRRLPCGHLFCSKCIMKWVMRESATCPTCRADIME